MLAVLSWGPVLPVEAIWALVDQSGWAGARADPFPLSAASLPPRTLSVQPARVGTLPQTLLPLYPNSCLSPPQNVGSFLTICLCVLLVFSSSRRGVGVRHQGLKS